MIKIKNSLSKKILFMVIGSFLMINIFIHSSISLLNKNTFYKLEGEKADIIVKNYAPLMAINLYLGMEDKLHGLLEQILRNSTVLKASIFVNDKVFIELVKEESTEGIIVSTPIYKPNSKEVLGRLQIVYSTKQFEELMYQYAILLSIALIVVIFAVMGLNLYIQKLLEPLKRLSSLLQNYSPESKIDIPYLDEKNEIGLISNALDSSHKKTVEYATNLQHLNETLEEKIFVKTEALRKQLFTEAITKLPNRLALLNTLSKSKKDAILAILCLDNYKEVNSFYGYEVGDELLIAAKDKIELTFNSSDYQLFKLPGNEFVIYSEKSEREAVFSAILYELTNILNKTPFLIGENEVHVTFTIGASINEKPLLAKADIALQEAYKLKQPVMIYNSTHEVEKQIDKNMQMIKKIKSAINDDRIVPYFQPIYDNKTGKIKSYESLVRLIEEDGKALSPYFFLDIAKKAKLYKQIAKIMIDKSCKRFQDSPYDFSLNFEIDDVLDEQLVDFTIKTMHKYGVSNQLTFEILESESIEDIEAVTDFTKLVSKHGCKISIDDFGSGYSNFLHVLKLNADYLKIDGSLIKNIDHDNEAQIIVRSIVKFAKELGLKVVAEFVHSDEVHDEVKKLGIDFSQGFLLGEPKPEIATEEELVLV